MNSPHPSRLTTFTDDKIGKLLVKQNILNKSQYNELMERVSTYRTEGQNVSLVDLAVKLNYASEDEIQQVMQANSRFKEIGGYHIISKIGSGGMGAVYKAKQLSMDREVAVKILSRSFSRNKNFIKRFYREARTAAKLNHPNIVRAIDVGKDRGRYYFAMALVKGVSLKEVIDKAEGPLDEIYSLYIVKQVVMGLEHATGHNIIHRDIKPDNILISPRRQSAEFDSSDLGQLDDVAKIVDLGIVKIEDNSSSFLTTAGYAVGTPQYISPEQAKGEEDVDFRSDIYSLGATLYHMLTHTPPFDGESLAKVLMAQVSEPLKEPREINSHISKGCSLMIQRMMRKNRDERYPSHEELLKDIELLLNGKNVTFAINPGKFRNLFTAFPKKNKWFWITISTLVFTILVVTLWAISR